MARLVFLLVLALGCTAARSASLFELSLPSLTELSQQPLGDYKNQYLIISMFEPECSWCLKQLKDLELLNAHCHSVLAPVAIGVGQRRGLQTLIRRAKITFPALEASPALIALTGQPEVTPFTLLINPYGELVTTLTGYIPLEKLEFAFQDIYNNS